MLSFVLLFWIVCMYLFMWIPCLWVHQHSLFHHSLANLKKKTTSQLPLDIYIYISTLEKCRSTNSLCVSTFLSLLFPVFTPTSSFYTTDSLATIIFNNIFIFTFSLLDFSHSKSSFFVENAPPHCFQATVAIIIIVTNDNYAVHNYGVPSFWMYEFLYSCDTIIIYFFHYLK